MSTLRARSREAKDDRRFAVMEAALATFYERGFAAARMEDIARRAGLSKGAVYLYFPSKEKLFTALVETIALPNVARIEAALESAPSVAAALDAVTRLAPEIITKTRVPQIAKVLIADAQSFPDMVSGYRRNVVERVLAAVAGLLERGVATGEIELDDPSLTARLVIAPAVMSVIWRVAFEHDPAARVDLDALFAAHRQLLGRALRLDGAEA